MIVVELFPGVGHMLKKERIELDFTGGTLGEALRCLLESHPHLIDDLSDGEQKIKSTLATFVNDERIHHDAHDDCEIRDGDRITILPPLSGG